MIISFNKFKGALVRAAALLAVVILSACTTVEFIPVIPSYPPPPSPARFYWERTLRTSNDVIGFSTEDRFKAMVTGERKGGKSLGKPYGIAVHQGRIFVSDTSKRNVAVFDLPGKKHFIIGGKKGEGKLRHPMAITVDAAGNVYVVDSTAKNVMKYTNDGEYITSFATEGELSRPTGVAVTPDGSRLFIVDTGGVFSDNHWVRVYDTATKKHLYNIGKIGIQKGEFNLPNNISLGKDGLLYVVDGGNFRIQVFTQEGEFVRTFGNIGRHVGEFSRPKGIATDKDNNVYVVDTAFGNFQIFTSEGQLLMHIGERNKRGAAGEYFLPAGIAVDEDGRVYVVDQYFRKVEVFRPAYVGKNEGYLAGAGPIDPVKTWETVEEEPETEPETKPQSEPAAPSAVEQAPKQ